MGAYLGLASGKGEKTNMKNMKKSITEFLCKVVGSSRGLVEAETIPSNIVSSPLLHSNSGYHSILAGRRWESSYVVLRLWQRACASAVISTPAWILGRFNSTSTMKISELQE